VNLKQAARRLGVHYQTAYKLVRSGRLAAVCIGSRYEISEAAIERYLAERQAMRRAPAKRPPIPSTIEPDDPFAPAEAALGAVSVSGATVIELVADALNALLGELVVVCELSHDHRWFLPAVVRHHDPVRRATVTATVGEFALEVRNSRVLSSVAKGSTVLKALVPQDCIHAGLDPEAAQYFHEAGVHSMIVVPAMSGDDVVGLVGVTRDTPGRPYKKVDVVTVERAAAMVGAAIARARLTSEAWGRRRALVDAVSSLLDAGANGPSARTVLGNSTVAEFVCDANGRVIAANDAAARLCGTAEGTIMGNRLCDLVAPDARERQRALLDRMLRGELSYADERLTFGTDDAGKASVAARYAVVRDVQSHPRAIVVVAHELPAP
jgi:excisionase family DNA binding protein/PAS domain S-box-containing protein